MTSPQDAGYYTLGDVFDRSLRGNIEILKDTASISEFSAKHCHGEVRS